jgi:hypothetical protein
MRRVEVGNLSTRAIKFTESRLTPFSSFSMLVKDNFDYL